MSDACERIISTSDARERIISTSDARERIISAVAAPSVSGVAA